MPPSRCLRHAIWPPANVRFGCQNYQLAQSQHTITYMRALQYWADKAQQPIPGQPHCLVKSVMELQQAMELLFSFTEAGVFPAMVPSNLTEVSSPRPIEPIPWDPCHSHSHRQSSQAFPRGSLLAAQGESWPIATAKTDAPTTPTQEMMLTQSDNTPMNTTQVHRDCTRPVERRTHGK